MPGGHGAWTGRQAMWVGVGQPVPQLPRSIQEGPASSALIEHRFPLHSPESIFPLLRPHTQVDTNAIGYWVITGSPLKIAKTNGQAGSTRMVRSHIFSGRTTRQSPKRHDEFDIVLSDRHTHHFIHQRRFRHSWGSTPLSVLASRAVRSRSTRRPTSCEWLGRHGLVNCWRCGR